MKISSVSKKVLASALSAAMVVAFAPTVAFGSQADGKADAQVTVNRVDPVTGKATSYSKVYYSDDASTGIAKALADVNDGWVKMELTPASTAVNGTPIAATYGFFNVSSADVTVSEGHGATDGAGGEAIAEGTYAKTTATVTMLSDTEGTLDVNQPIVLDLGGNTLTNDLDGIVDTAPTKGVDAIQISAAGVVVKNGAVKAVTVNTDGGLDNAAKKSDAIVLDANSATVDIQGVAIEATDDAVDGYNYALETPAKYTNTAVTLASGTYGSVKAAKVKVGTAKVAAEVTTGAIDAEVEMAASSKLTATASSVKDGVHATAISGGVTLAKNATVVATATTSGDNAVATAINGSVTGNQEGATVEATATANGYVDTVNTANAIGVTGANISKGKLVAKATSISGTAKADSGDLTVTGGEVELSAEGAYAENSIAAGNVIAASAGTYTGITTFRQDDPDTAETNEKAVITGGSWTSDPTSYVNADTHVVTDEYPYYTVSKAQQFDVDFGKKTGVFAENDNDDVVSEAVEYYLRDIAAGKTPTMDVTYAEGVTADKVLAQAKNANAPLKIVATTAAYVERKATDAEKAEIAAIDAYNKANLYKLAADGAYTVYSLTLGVLNSDGTTYTTLATINSLGSKTVGRTTTDFKIVLAATDAPNGIYAVSNNGNVAKGAYDLGRDGKPAKNGAEKYTISAQAIPAAVAEIMVDEEAVKDAANQKPETPAEKATQSIDVAQKSKTVKLAKGKAKTQKAVSFKLGASAETELTIAKKSGSSRISVSGQKVTLKKGTKKGTFTAKVSLKAAGSDEFLAAAKTITVKFVVKK